MDIQVTDAELKAARVPHDLMMVNLIGNHILWFVVGLGLLNTFWLALALVPFVSLGITGYILWRSQYSQRKDSWFVMVNWQIAAKRSRFFLMLLSGCLVIASVGAYGYFELHWMREAVIAFVGGVGVLPIMATVLVLIIMESDSLDQVNLKRVSDRLIEQFPRP